MKKMLFILLALFLSISNLNAQEGKMHVGAGLELALPIGDWSDVAGTGIGGTGRFEYAFTRQIVGMLTTGYISFGGDDIGGISYSYSAVPFLPGVKYYFQNGLYGMAELGLHFFSVEVDFPDFGGFNFGGSNTASNTEFSFSIGGGYERQISDKLILDANVKFALVSNSNYLGVRIGAKMPL